MKIQARMGAGFGIILLLLIIVGVTSIRQIDTVISSYQNEMEQLNKLQILSEGLISDVLNIRRNEKNFLLYQKDEYPKLVISSISKAKKKTGEMASITNSAQVKKLAASMAKNISSYRDGFNRFTILSQTRGLDQNSGFQGEFSKAAHGVGNALKASEFSQAEVLYLTARKNEKDYMLQRSDNFVSETETNIVTLQTMVDESSLGWGVKNSLSDKMETYLRAFAELVDIDREIGEQLSEIQQQADTAIKRSQELDKIINNQRARLAETINSQSETATVILRILVTVAVLIGITFSYLFSKRIAIAIGCTAEMINELDKGNLEHRITINRKDEIGEMARALNSFADTMKDEILAAFNALSAGNFTFKANGVIKEPLQRTNESMTSLIKEIHSAADQVASGSRQVSDSSMSLSDGAASQAGSLQEITSSMIELGSQTKQNANNANEVTQLATDTNKIVSKGNQQMIAMIDAMSEINRSSENISKIIKSIDSIAFQTNLLALNAATEAARAGRYGKGFAVVAEEVRSLAAKSAEAARETTELIQNSVQKSENGAIIVNEMAASLDSIMTSIAQVSNVVEEITDASHEQAQGFAQVNQGLDGISHVTHSTSASAEESASASVELASQSQRMLEMLEHFSLDEVDTEPLALPETNVQIELEGSSIDIIENIDVDNFVGKD